MSRSTLISRSSPGTATYQMFSHTCRPRVLALAARLRSSCAAGRLIARHLPADPARQRAGDGGRERPEHPVALAVVGGWVTGLFAGILGGWLPGPDPLCDPRHTREREACSRRGPWTSSVSTGTPAPRRCTRSRRAATLRRPPVPLRLTGFPSMTTDDQPLPPWLARRKQRSNGRTPKTLWLLRSRRGRRSGPECFASGGVVPRLAGDLERHGRTRHLTEAPQPIPSVTSLTVPAFIGGDGAAGDPGGSIEEQRRARWTGRRALESANRLLPQWTPPNTSTWFSACSS